MHTTKKSLLGVFFTYSALIYGAQEKTETLLVRNGEKTEGRLTWGTTGSLPTPPRSQATYTRHGYRVGDYSEPPVNCNTKQKGEKKAHLSHFPTTSCQSVHKVIHQGHQEA